MENKYQEEKTEKNYGPKFNTVNNKSSGVDIAGIYLLITPIFIIGLLVASFIVWNIIKDSYNSDFLSYLSWEYIPILVIAFILLLFVFLWLLLTINSKLNYVIKSIKNNNKNKVD
ncbi:hypothetical protein EPJ67_06195 [Brachyspira aalborgi]|uniref:Uncharacterized protein n=1 Tax=Brachyspira aalborgi TaxID=29522 RepID=A0A5C8G4J3_9SPIR|nr:hypothetical protein [Brachyspira aalborgi]TXJ56963.1 hypothetical protein EPJ67_06195 [Brachyspira aalborgi]